MHRHGTDRAGDGQPDHRIVADLAQHQPDVRPANGVLAIEHIDHPIHGPVLCIHDRVFVRVGGNQAELTRGAEVQVCREGVDAGLVLLVHDSRKERVDQIHGCKGQSVAQRDGLTPSRQGERAHGDAEAQPIGASRERHGVGLPRGIKSIPREVNQLG